jgi:hypothetical protein
VEQGGILVSRGPIKIEGNILRGPSKEPLTIVSGRGDIILSPGVEIVEAYLVTLSGKVRFSSSAVIVIGGIAAHDFDLESIRAAPAARTVRYAEDLDPIGPGADRLHRTYYGGEERISVIGGGQLMRRDTGVTFVEALVVTIIVLLVCVVSYNAFYVLFRSERSTDRESARALLESQLLELLFQDVRSSISVSEVSPNTYQLVRLVPSGGAVRSLSPTREGVAALLRGA